MKVINFKDKPTIRKTKMPRSKPKKPAYKEEDILRAVAEIRNGNTSLRKASVKYGVPKSTLSDKLNLRVPLAPSMPGPSSFLSKKQEDRLKSYLINMSKIGCGITRRQIPDVVKQVLDEAEASGYIIQEHKKFEENRPSLNWVSPKLICHSPI